MSASVCRRSAVGRIRGSAVPFIMACSVVICSAVAGFSLAFAEAGSASDGYAALMPAETMVIPTHADRPALEGIEDEACVPVTEVRIEGIALIDRGALQARLMPLAYRCMGNGVARALVGAINEAHADAGFVTTQGYLPDQDIRRSGALLINVIPGRIDKIIYKEEGRDGGASWLDRADSAWKSVRKAEGPWGLTNAVSGLLEIVDDPLDRFQLIDGARWPGVKRWVASELRPGNVVAIDDVQHAVDALNTVGSNRTEAKLAPGDEPATSTVVLTNRRADTFRMIAGFEVNGAGFDGSERTISKRLRLDTAKDNLIGINDSWSGSFASGLDSNEARARLSIPWRRLNLTLEGVYSEQATALTRSTELFYQSGYVIGSASYMLERSRTHQTLIDTSLAWRRIERDINGRQLMPQRTSVARIGLSRTHNFETTPLKLLFGARSGADTSHLLGSQLSWGAGISRGLTIWDATRDGARPDPTAPRAQFWKFDGRVGVAQGLRDIGVLRLDIFGQWARYPLYADDQQVLGSISTVRGFMSTAARVDRGFVMRTEFAPTLPVDAWLSEAVRQARPFLNDMLRAVQPYTFHDFGHGRDLANKADLTRASLGGGLRFSHGRTNFDLSFARPLLDNSRFRGKKGAEVYFSINTKLL